MKLKSPAYTVLIKLWENSLPVDHLGGHIFQKISRDIGSLRAWYAFDINSTKYLCTSETAASSLSQNENQASNINFNQCLENGNTDNLDQGFYLNVRELRVYDMPS